MIFDLNHVEQLKAENEIESYSQIQSSRWNSKTLVNSHFDLTKQEIMFEEYDERNVADLIY